MPLPQLNRILGALRWVLRVFLRHHPRQALGGNVSDASTVEVVLAVELENPTTDLAIALEKGKGHDVIPVAGREEVEPSSSRVDPPWAGLLAPSHSWQGI